MGAVIARNGLDPNEAVLLARCFKRALCAMATPDRKACSVRLVVGERWISVMANNHLVIRAPAWGANKVKAEGDIMLIWPRSTGPSIMSPSRFRREWFHRFKLVPCVILSLTWAECLELSKRDWEAFRRACHDALVPNTRRWMSNVTYEQRDLAVGCLTKEKRRQ
jgi:hypothetical protein